MNTENVVGNAFAAQYYHTLHTYPEMVCKFYQDSSVLSRPDVEGVMTSVKTVQCIKEKIISWNFKDYTSEIKTVDSQQSYMNGITVLVSGCLIGRDDLRRNFAQAFFLAPQEKRIFFRIKLALLSMEGPTIHWFNLLRETETDLCWETFKKALANRYGGRRFENPYKELSDLRQTDTVKGLCFRCGERFHPLHHLENKAALQRGGNVRILQEREREIRRNRMYLERREYKGVGREGREVRRKLRRRV
ncbi:hypothetical protein K2173_012285 [Erythroxylum novogranatense]|uniref:NTF2 domain-containing protein n=1 Tax=Erythroxylum novogranatense TaxID=1862640 RepID=A0AAV8SCG2_9ROSI|nr:hypothetical protein K2173_012285 [Erythroxylum novogranatense]